MFRDLVGGLSKDLKDGERGLRRAHAGGGSWRLTFKSFVMLGEGCENESNNLAACFPQDSRRRIASSGKANDQRNRARVVLDLFSNLKMCEIQWLLLLNF